MSEEKKKNPTVLEILREYLKGNGYDGLYSADDVCGCDADDLAPCFEVGPNCRAGHLIDPPQGEEGPRYGPRKEGDNDADL